MLLEVPIEEGEHSAEIGRPVHVVGATVVSIWNDPELFRFTGRTIEPGGILRIDYRVLPSLDQQHRSGSQVADGPQRLDLVQVIARPQPEQQIDERSHQTERQMHEAA